MNERHSIVAVRDMSHCIFESQRTCNRLLEHLQHHRMIGADDGSFVFDPENLLLDEAEFFVVGRSSEELGDHPTDIIFVISGGIGELFCWLEF